MLADPPPGRVDPLLGVEVLAAVRFYGWRLGPFSFPIVFEAKIGWNLAGSTLYSYPLCIPIIRDSILYKLWNQRRNHCLLFDVPRKAQGSRILQSSSHRRIDTLKICLPLHKKPIVSFNDFLMIGPTVHSSLIDIFLAFSFIKLP